MTPEYSNEVIEEMNKSLEAEAKSGKVGMGGQAEKAG